MSVEQYDVRALVVAEISAILSALCPCEGLRAQRDEQYQRAQSLQNSLLTEIARVGNSEAERDSLRAERNRLWDLVRQQRMELHTAGLITDREYADLAKDHAAVARLESYDEIRAELAAIRDKLRKASEAASHGVAFPSTDDPVEDALFLLRTLPEELAASLERERVLREALERIEKFKPEVFDYTEAEKHAWRDAVAACPECISYQGHPIQRGICDDHRRFLYRRDEINTRRENTQDREMRTIAADALATPETKEKP